MTQKRALVLTGGGARGAYQVGVLKYIAENIDDPEFKILLGSSAGAINVATLASHEGSFQESVSEMERVWSSLQIHDVLKIDFFSLLKMALVWPVSLLISSFAGHPLVSSLIDSSPLRNLIFKIFKPEVVTRSIESGRLETLAIVATEVSTASSVTFVQSKEHHPWRRANRRSVATKISHKHVLASSAIPVIFKSIRIGQKQYLDGSVRSNTPLSPAARLGATEIFSIGVRKVAALQEKNFDEFGSSEFEAEPTVAQVGGLILNALFSDSLDSDADHLKRINELLVHVDQKVALDVAGMKPIQVELVRPSEDIGKIAKQFTHRLPFFLRLLLRSLGSEKSDSSDIVSYLLFDAAYARHLIDLGYRDATAQRQRILAFFAKATATTSKAS